MIFTRIVQTFCITFAFYFSYKLSNSGNTQEELQEIDGLQKLCAFLLPVLLLTMVYDLLAPVHDLIQIDELDARRSPAAS